MMSLYDVSLPGDVIVLVLFGGGVSPSLAGTWKLSKELYFWFVLLPQKGKGLDLEGCKKRLPSLKANVKVFSCNASAWDKLSTLLFRSLVGSQPKAHIFSLFPLKTPRSRSKWEGTTLEIADIQFIPL